jgi:hypothetical protein
MEHNPELIVYTLVISRKIMTIRNRERETRAKKAATQEAKEAKQAE